MNFPIGCKPSYSLTPGRTFPDLTPSVLSSREAIGSSGAMLSVSSVAYLSATAGSVVKLVPTPRTKPENSVRLVFIGPENDSDPVDP